MVKCKKIEVKFLLCYLGELVVFPVCVCVCVCACMHVCVIVCMTVCMCIVIRLILLSSHVLLLTVTGQTCRIAGRIVGIPQF